jgi:predicted TIM-barrel fold metal-dependent hydrolase
VLSAETPIISVDDHLIEPPSLWQDRLPAKMKSAGPKVVRTSEGSDAWVCEGVKYELFSTIAVAGRDRAEWSRGIPFRYDAIRPGAYDPAERVRDMEIDGVAAQINFPTFPRFAGTRFAVEVSDKRLAMACVQAWNDFVLDEWCATAPDRFIPMVIVPLWDPKLAAGEVVRTAERGAKAISFPENPAPLGLPSLRTGHWDPFFAVVQEADLPLCLHFGTSGLSPYIDPDAPQAVSSTLVACNNAMSALANAIFSPVPQMFPNLRFVLSESGIGWMPYFLERLDLEWDQYRYAEDLNFGTRPSDVFRRQFWGCSISETFGIDHRAHIGVERIMLESDYPHVDSSWPNTRTRAAAIMANVPDDEARMIAELNARAVFKLDPSVGTWSPGVESMVGG